MPLLTFNLAYQAGWLLFALVCLFLYWNEPLSADRQRRDRIAFCLMGGVMLAFASCRPLGVSVDDEGYLGMFQRICPTLSCGEIIQGGRDRVWYSLVGLLKSFHDQPRVMLWLSGLGLLLKLWVLDRLCRHRSLALLAYAGIFYVVQDITALRVALATAVYLLGFHYLVRAELAKGVATLFSTGLFHVQGVVAPLLLLGRCWPMRLPMTALLILMPFVLLLAGVYPHAGMIAFARSLPLGIDIIDWLGRFYPSLPTALGSASAGLFKHARSWPVVLPPTLTLALWWVRDVFRAYPALFRYSATSLLIACWLLWGAGAVPHLQFRLWDFFLVPLVLVIGNIRATRLNVLAVMVLGGLYVIKYTVLHDLLLDASDCRSVRLEASTGGHIRAMRSDGNTCFISPDLAFISGTQALFQPVADKGYRWVGWEGACEGSPSNCKLVIENPVTVGARFTPIQTVSLDISGKGIIESGVPGKACKRACRLTFDRDSHLTLTAKPDGRYRWAGWSGACEGAQPICELTLNQDQAVAARFIAQLEVAFSATPGGRVVVEPDGVECPGICRQTFDDGAVARVRAVAEPGFRFAGWGGACGGVEPVCELSVNGKKKVSARFERSADGLP